MSPSPPIPATLTACIAQSIARYQQTLTASDTRPPFMSEKVFTSTQNGHKMMNLTICLLLRGKSNLDSTCGFDSLCPVYVNRGAHATRRFIILHKRGRPFRCHRAPLCLCGEFAYSRSDAANPETVDQVAVLHPVRVQYHRQQKERGDRHDQQRAIPPSQIGGLNSKSADTYT